MRGYLKYQFLSYIRSLKLIPPITVFAAWVFILYAYKNVPILSSYEVTSIALYLSMTWVAMGIFSIEEESEKHLLFIQLGSKTRFIRGKWIICIVVAIILGSFAIVYPVAMNDFKGTFKPIHLWLSIYSHFFLALFGLLVGTFFSVTSFASKKYAWLSAVLLLVISLSSEGIVGKMDFLKWPLILFPPVVSVLKFMSGNDSVRIGASFWIQAALVICYTIGGFIFTERLFLRKER